VLPAAEGDDDFGRLGAVQHDAGIDVEGFFAKVLAQLLARVLQRTPAVVAHPIRTEIGAERLDGRQQRLQRLKALVERPDRGEEI
jgi:hypothetical protein